MIKVILVDDESFLLEMLEVTIDWADYDMEIVGSFYNGEQALDYAETHEVDIVISDMMMPVMDGLELLREIKKAKPQMEFVVLSAYNEFELVRSFFREGAFDYLVKIDIDSDQTKDVLSRLSRIVWEKKMSGSREERILYVLCHGAEQFMEGADRSVVVVSASIVNSELMQEFNHIVSEIKRSCECVCYNSNDGEAVFLLQKSENLQKNLNEIKKRLELAPFKILAGSSIADSIERMSVLLEEARQGANYSFYVRETLIPYMFIPARNQKIQAVETVALDMCKIYIANNCSESNIYKIKDKIMETLAAYENWNLSYQNALSGAEELILYLNGQLKEAGYTDAVFDEKASYFYEAVCKAESYCRMKGLLEEYMNVLLAEKQQEGTERLIARICSYIDNNYDRDLNLKEIAKQFGISENYLSRRFVKEKNITFKRYVNVLKIEKAKEYLENTTLRIGEICKRLGYNSMEHFSRIFKEETGFSPSEYRSIGKTK